MVEAQKGNNEDSLVEELTPSLHQESAGNFATSVKTIFLGGDLAGTHGILHSRRRRHGIFATNTDAVEEQGPHITDDPAIQSSAPSTDKHDQTNEHDGCVLNQTPSTTEPRHALASTSPRVGNTAGLPITKNPDQDLSNDYTNNLHVVNSLDPCGVTYFGRFPASCEHSLEHGFDVADGEEDVTIDMSDL